MSADLSAIIQRELPLRDGWWFDAVDGPDHALPDQTRARFRGYEYPLAPRLYDLDLRFMSRVMWGASLRVQAEQLRAALRHAADLGLPLLDLPVGTGLVLAKVLRTADDPPPVVVADLSLAMLRRTRRRLGPSVTYVRCDVEHLPFVNGAFGAVHSANGLHLFPDLDAATAEIGRVAAPGAAASIVTWAAGGPRLPAWWMHTFARRGFINPAVPRSRIEDALTAAAFEPVAVEQHGTTLRWFGLRPEQ